MSVYWALCVSLHVISVVSKSKSEGLACLSYILFIAYCTCDEINYLRSGACVMCIYRVYFLSCRALECGGRCKKGAY